jgi:hypothetical protein
MSVVTTIEVKEMTVGERMEVMEMGIGDDDGGHI